MFYKCVDCDTTGTISLYMLDSPGEIHVFFIFYILLWLSKYWVCILLSCWKRNLKKNKINNNSRECNSYLFFLSDYTMGMLALSDNKMIIKRKSKLIAQLYCKESKLQIDMIQLIEKLQCHLWFQLFIQISLLSIDHQSSLGEHIFLTIIKIY